MYPCCSHTASSAYHSPVHVFGEVFCFSGAAQGAMVYGFLGRTTGLGCGALAEISGWRRFGLG